MINNRQQAGRRRGRGGGGNGNGGGPRQGGQGRPDNGNRIDNRARGNASQLYEKYKNLASDAQRQGDRVNTEYYLQFADHYFRVLSDQRGRFEEQQPRRQQPDFDIDGDEDFGDEGEPIRAGEQGEPRQDRAERAERQDRSDRQDRAERQRDARRQDGDQPERPRRWEREERAPRQPEGEMDIAGQRRAEPTAPNENQAGRAEAVSEADTPLQNDVAPRRRGRPRRETTPVEAVEVEGGNGVDADRLPPSLGIAAANDSDDDAPKPRRRRVRTTAPGEASAS